MNVKKVYTKTTNSFEIVLCRRAREVQENNSNFVCVYVGRILCCPTKALFGVFNLRIISFKFFRCGLPWSAYHLTSILEEAVIHKWLFGQMMFLSSLVLHKFNFITLTCFWSVGVTSKVVGMTPIQYSLFLELAFSYLYA